MPGAWFSKSSKRPTVLQPTQLHQPERTATTVPNQDTSVQFHSTTRCTPAIFYPHSKPQSGSRASNAQSHAPCSTLHALVRASVWTAAALPPLWIGHVCSEAGFSLGRVGSVLRMMFGDTMFGDKMRRSFPRAALRLPWAEIPPPRWGGSPRGAPAAGRSVSAARRNLTPWCMLHAVARASVWSATACRRFQWPSHNPQAARRFDRSAQCQAAIGSSAAAGWAPAVGAPRPGGVTALKMQLLRPVAYGLCSPR
jgi:hypothetical protein